MDKQKNTGRFTSLSSKIIAVSISIICVVVAMLVIILTYRESIFLMDNFERRGQDMASGIREASRIALLAEDIDRLALVAAEGMRNRQEILYMSFYNPDGQIIYCLSSSKLVQEFVDHDGSPCLQQMLLKDKEWSEGGMAQDRTLREFGPVSEFWVLVKSSESGELDMFAEPAPGFVDQKVGRVSGYICLGVSEERLRSTLVRIVKDAVIAGVLALLFISAVSVLLLKRLTRPLSELAHGVQAVAEGKTKVIIPVQSDDEVGRLALEFNKMVVSLKERQEMLQESESRHRSLFEQIHHGILLFDEDGVIIDSNPAMAQMVGCEDPQSLINIYFSDLFKSSTDYADLQEAVIKGDVVHDRHMLLKRWDDEDVETTVSITGRRDENGVFEYAEVVIVDISHLKELEKRLLHAHKMEAIGTLAGGIAHDFNNLLTGITGYTSLLRMQVEVSSNDKLYDYVLSIQKSAQRAAALVSQLMGFARKGLYEETDIQINYVIQEIQGLLQETIDRSVCLRVDLAADLWTVRGDEGQIHQSLLNISLNACDAMLDGGTLWITTDNFINKLDMPVVDTVMPPGNYCRTKIIDNGTGMSEEVSGKMFEPFFTTKGMGKGTGLGMAMVHGIISNHGGFIDVVSETGKGTTVTIYLPVMAETVDVTQLSNGKHEELYPVGPVTVLLVDDEEVIRDFCQLYFSTQDHTLVVAASGEEALDILTMTRQNIDLVILDISMPGIGGAKTYRILREKYPDLPVVLATGYARDDAVNRLLDEGAADLILKPYEGKDLLAVISSVLGEKMGEQFGDNGHE